MNIYLSMFHFHVFFFMGIIKLQADKVTKVIHSFKLMTANYTWVCQSSQFYSLLIIMTFFCFQEIKTISATPRFVLISLLQLV